MEDLMNEMETTMDEIQYIVVEMQTLDHIQRTYQDGLYEQREDFIEEVKKDSSPFICVNPNMKSILNMAKRIADMDTTILITGETGTGKQVLVDYIVSQSHLASKQVVSINCSSIPENLFESELFGYESGSFTGASKNGKMGLFEAADIDGATGWKKFRYITLPLLKPIMLYTLVTSAIGGLQMYDIPALFNVPETGLVGLPDDKTTTMAMYIMRLYNSDVGKAAAVSVVLFIITLVVSLILFATMSDSEDRRMKKEQKQRRKAGGRS